MRVMWNPSDVKKEAKEHEDSFGTSVDQKPPSFEDQQDEEKQEHDGNSNTLPILQDKKEDKNRVGPVEVVTHPLSSTMHGDDVMQIPEQDKIYSAGPGSHQPLVPMLWKTFIFHCPKKSVVKVMVSFESIAQNDKNLERVHDSETLWMTTIPIEPDISPNEKYSYSLYRDTWFDKKWSAGPFYLGEKAINRDSFDELSVEAVKAHLDHIIFSPWIENRSTMLQKCIEIEALSLGNGEVQDVIGPIAAKLHVQRPPWQRLLLFAVALGHLCRQSNTTPDKVILSSVVSDAVLDALPLCSIDYLTGSAQFFIADVCSALIDNSVANGKCVMTSLQVCIEFLRLSDPLSLLQHFQKNFKGIKVCNNVVLETQKLLETIFDLSPSRQCKDGNKSIAFLVDTLPFDLIFTVHLNCQNEDDSMIKILNEMIQNNLNARIQNITSFVKEKDCISLLNFYWKNIYKAKNERKMFESLFQDTVIRFLELNKKTVEGCANDIRDLATKYELFQDFEFQVRLLEVLSHVEDAQINNLFVELLKLAGKVVYKKLKQNCFEQWYFSSFKTRTSNPSLRDSCLKLSLLLKLPDFADNQEMVEVLKEILNLVLSNMKPQDIVNEVETIDEISTELPLLRKMVIEVISSKLKASSDHEKILSSFVDSKTQKMTLATKIQAEIVCMIIDKCGHFQQDSIEIESFFSIVKKEKFWLKLFQVTGNPKYVKILKAHKLYKTAQQCICHTFERMKTGDVGFIFLEEFKRCSTEAKHIISVVVDSAETDKVLLKLTDQYEQERETIHIVLQVLQRIAEKNRHLPNNFSSLLDIIYQIKDDFESGKILAKQCKDIWARLNHLEKMCTDIKEVTLSDVFWNVYQNQELQSKQLTQDSQENEVSETGTSEEQEDIQSAEKQEIGDTVNEEKNRKEVSNVIQFVQSLNTTGLYEYRKALGRLEEGTSIGMEDVIHMFGKSANVEEEKKISDNLLANPVPQSVWVALDQVYSVSEVHIKVEAMKGCLKALGIELQADENLSSAFTSFEKLLNESFTECTFEVVKTGMSMIFSLVNKISNKTTDIMQAISKSSSLVSFLRDTVHEDTRNLIDAVEDISEQYVRESTVSGLIDVKRYLKPVLTTDYSGRCFKLFESLEKQTVHLENVANLPGKIVDCADNFHNLKSLYNNVANRGEQTKEVVKSVIERGQFRFKFEDKSNTLVLEACYTQNENDSTEENGKKTHHATAIAKIDKASLVDLRSRALLLMNTERDDNFNRRLSQKELGQFVEYVDHCFTLADILLSLHSSGHVYYIDIEKVIEPSELERNITDLKKLSYDWLEHLQQEREQFYLLNFIRGPNLHVLYKYLEQCSELEQPSKPNLTESVETLLFFLHPDMKTDKMRHYYYEKKKSYAAWNTQTMLHCIGYALDKIFPSTREGMEETKIFLSDETDNVRSSRYFKMTDIVQNGTPLVAQLDEGSAYTVKTVIALYALTTKHALPISHQVLFCTRETTADELQLLIERCLGEYKFRSTQSLFCIANVEMLSSELQFLLLEILKNIKERFNCFLLAIVCRGSKNHPIIDELSEFVTTVTPASDAIVQSVFLRQCPDVVTITSDLPGQGKTSFIRETAHRIKKGVKVLHISGSVRKLQLIERLRCLRVRKHNLLHIEISDVDNPTELDTFLFELISLKYVSCDRMSAGLNTSHVYLEIANTLNEKLRNTLQTAMLFNREHITWKNFDNFAVSNEIQSPVQVVCRYLDYLDKDILDKEDIMTGNDEPLPEKHCKTYLRKYFGHLEDMSFPSVNTAVRVLADQFKRMSCSPFFQINRLKDMVGNRSFPNIKSSLVLAMIKSSNDFAIRSARACRRKQSSSLSNEIMHDSGKLEQVSVLAQRVEGMIRWEHDNHLMFVFHRQNIQTMTPIYSEISEVPHEVKNLFETQMKKELQDFRKMSQIELQDLLQRIARNDPQPLPSARLKEMARTYALTPDNLLKMALIVLRINAHVPVVVMGETGCGKTSLLRYLANICEIPFDALNIHAGLSEEQITKKVLKSSKKASSNSERWLFLDEVNASNNIGLISDIICHHRCLDENLSPNLIVIGACNPYKLRSEKAINTAGLTGKLKSDELSKLVYRVHPLPEKMIDYVWDFGSLNKKDEECYISRMISDVFDQYSGFHELFTAVLSESQRFVRRKESSEYAVSLRDVYRCKILTVWFLKILRDLKQSPKHPYTFKCNIEIRAIVLALAHCYHSRFSDKNIRQEYRNVISRKFVIKTGDEGGDESTDYIKTIITEEQKDLLSRMEVPEGTARNTALMENVFIIFVCIFNKIPVFVVGKPGCSKSLAMQVIRSNIRGKDSKDPFFRKLPQLYCVSYQGSESSTSDGILKVFKKAEKYQMSNNADDVLSVVILDEIGLAEVSRFNPLKVLHSLLESEKGHGLNIAVVGLSNWALDASKMNRAVHLSRTDMDAEELYETAKSISSSFLEDNTVREKSEQARFLKGFEKPDTENVFTEGNVDSTLKRIAEAYSSYMKQLLYKNFHGLRDFYALVKHIARTCAKSQHINKNDDQKYFSDIVMDGLERNFAGLPVGTDKLIQIFRDHFDFQKPGQNHILDMISENVNDPISRHLMLITNGDSSLGIIEQRLNTAGRERKEVIFGSQFEDDLTDDYNYRILSKIILCMEEGVVLVLKDLENIYGSLYDMLNQNYTIIGNKKNCRVALGAYSNPFCHVATTFRCIVLMDESKISTCDPPFLNRFEKHYLRFSDIVNEEQSKLIQELNCWLFDIMTITDRNFKFTDVLPVYSEDLTASLVWKMKSSLKQSHQDNIEGCKRQLLMLLNPAAIIRLKKAQSQDIRSTAEEIKQTFFRMPLHKGLNAFISNQLETLSSGDTSNGLLTIIFTNSNVHTKLQKCINDRKVQIDKLGIFKTEKQLTQRINNFWFNEDGTEILMIQCSAVDDEKHILLTKTIIEQCRANALTKKEETSKHVYLIIHLDKSKGTSKVTSQINFVSEWNIVMLDNLECPETSLLDLCEMEPLDAVKSKAPLQNCLMEELLWAFTRIKYGPFGRGINSIRDILNDMKRSSEFMEVLGNAVLENVSIMDRTEKDWQLNVACDVQALRNSATFIDALEQRIMRIIKVPLAKLIYNMEMHGILDCFFIFSNAENRRKSWNSVLKDKRFFSIDEIPDDADQPESYVCITDDLSLCMPFSRTIFNLIEAQRDEFLEELSQIKARNCWEPGEDLPRPVYAQLLKQYEKLILLNIPDSRQFFYKYWEKDYIQDFCNILSMPMCPSIDHERRTHYMRWVVSQKTSLNRGDPCKLLVSLHATSWVNSTLYRAEMQLFGLCENVLTEGQILLDILQLKVPCKNEKMHPEEVPESEEFSTEDSNAQTSWGNTEDSKLEIDDVSINLNTPLQQQVTAFENENEYEVDTHLSSDILDICPENILVQHICERMLPTQDTINAYRGVKIWQRKINTVLVLAAKVSNKSKQLHALRVCNDIASSVIIPLNLNTNCFWTMGSLLANGHSLDSEKVFMSVFDIISKGLKKCEDQRRSVQDVYAMLSSYLVCCIDYNSATEVQECLFQKILSGELSEDIIPFLKAPLSKLFDIEEEEFFNLIGLDHQQEDVASDFDSMDDETTISDDEETEDSTSGQSFIDQVNSVLKRLHNAKKEDSALVLLFVDILQILYEKQMEPNATNILRNFSETLYSCHKTLHEASFGIEYIASVSFMKAFFSRRVQLTHDDTDKTRELWNEIAIVLNKGEDEVMKMMLLNLFLKAMLSSFTLCQLKQFLERREDVYRFLRNISWSVNVESLSFERSPLCQLIDTSLHKKYPYCKQDIKQKMINLQESMQLSNSTCSGLLTMFTFAARVFYFPKICEPLTDTKRTLATSIIRQYTQHRCKGVHVIEYLVGMSDFKIPVFNINEQTSHSEYCVSSFFMALYLILLAKNEFIEGEKRPFLIECLVDPQAIGKYFLPGFFDSEHENDETADQAISSCGCGYRKVLQCKNKLEYAYTCSSCLEKPEVHHTITMSCSCGYRTVLISEDTGTYHQCFFCEKQLESKSAVLLSCTCDSYTLYDSSSVSEENRWCLFCMDIAKRTEGNVKKVAFSQNRHVLWKLEDYENIGFSVRGLHPVTVHILQMLVKGCLLGSLAFGISLTKDIEEITSMTDLDNGHSLWSDIKQHWHLIASHLNLNHNDMSIMLHNVLSKSTNILVNQTDSFTLSEKRRQFEKHLDVLIASKISNASETVKTTLRNHEQLHGITEKTIESTLFETDDMPLHERSGSHLLFRVNYSPTKHNFICKFSLRRKEFPFLNLVLRYERYLKLPKHIFNIIGWHMAILTRANYVMKKHDCLEMKVEDFIYYNQEPNHEQIRKRFEKFEKSWNKIDETFTVPQDFAENGRYTQTK